MHPLGVNNVNDLNLLSVPRKNVSYDAEKS